MTVYDKRLARSHDDILEAVAAALDIPPGKFEEARQRYEALGGWLDRPESTLAWLWLGKTYEAKGDKTQAALAQRKAKSINKAMADAFEQGLQSLTNHPNTLLPADAKP